MTNVVFESYYDSHTFECVGHTGYAEAGSDILCSAVSVLCYALYSYLYKCEAEGKIKNLKETFSYGNVIFQFDCDDIFCEVYTGLDALFGGFRYLSESFPDYVNAVL